MSIRFSIIFFVVYCIQPKRYFSTPLIDFADSPYSRCKTKQKCEGAVVVAANGTGSDKQLAKFRKTIVFAYGRLKL